MNTHLRQNIGIIVIAIIGLMISLVVYSTLDRWQNERVNDSFAKRANHKQNVLNDIVNKSESKLTSLKAFFDNSKNVTRSEFRGFANALFTSKNKKLECFYWIPKQQLDSSGPDQDNRAPSDDSGNTTFSVKFKYRKEFPLFEVGSNLLESKRVRKTLQNGEADRTAQATDPFQVKIGDQNEWVVLLLHPVMERKSGSGTEPQINGFVAGVFNLSESITYVFRRSPSVFTQLTTSSSRNSPFIQFPPEHQRTALLESAGWKRYFVDQFTQQKTLQIAEKHLNVVYTTGPELLNRINVLLAPAGAMMVLVLTGLLIVYVRGLQNRKNLIEEKVDKQTRKLKKANQAKSEFLAQMSHEIRTPLNAIMGMTDLLHRTSLEHEQKEYLRISKESSEVLLHLINDILDLSKMEAGQLELNREPFQLEPFVNDTVSYFAKEAGEKGLDLHVFVDGDCPAVIDEDKNRLRQVLINLVKNAIKYTETGEVNVRVWYEEGDDEHRLHVEVEDTGIGIPEEKQEGLFERFSQLDATNERGGTGLGLSITRELLALMNGDIDVESQVGVGSTFHVQIPVHLLEEDQNGQLQRVDAHDAGSDFADLDVLVVDDSSTNRLLLDRVLTNWEVDVTEAETGQEALEKIRQRRDREDPFDLVLLDRQLPDMNGFEVMEEIADGHPVDNVVIMLSSDEQMGDRGRADQLGLGDYLVKPVDRSELQEAINNVIHDEAYTVERETSLHRPDENELTTSASILVAEDNKHNRKVIQAMLSDYPVAYDFAEDGEEALDMAKAHSYDLIFMDIRMPGMDGLEVTRAYRAWEQETKGSSHTPIVALTAQALEEHRKESLNAGCDDHLSKPIREEKIIEAIRFYVEPSAEENDEGDERGTTGKDEDPCIVIDRRYEDFIPDLKEDVREKMERIKEEAEQEQFDEVEDLAHDVKGAAGSFGFERIQNLAEEIETHARSREPEKICSEAADIIDYLERVTITFE